MNQTILAKKKELVREHTKKESKSKSKNKINYDQESKYNNDAKQTNRLFICGSSGTACGVNYII